MRVLYDTSSLSGSGLTGIGVYARELYKELRHLNLQLVPFIKTSRALKRANITAKGLDQPAIWSFLRLRKTDIIFGPDFKLPETGRCKKAVMVHDMLAFEKGLLDEEFARAGRDQFAKMLKNSRPDAVICNSHNTAERFQFFFNSYPPEKVFVTALGCDHIKTSPLPYKKKSPYVLSVGTMEKRKNYVRLIQAFDLIASEFDQLKLVLVGRPGFEFEKIQHAMAESRFSDRIDYKGYCSDEELALLYQQALVFAYPSLYEGFGIPMLEAMLAGTPVVTSDHGAMNEISGNAAVKAKADNVESIAGKIRGLLNDQGKAQGLIARGYSHVKKYTWAETARKTLEVFKQLN